MADGPDGFPGPRADEGFVGVEGEAAGGRAVGYTEYPMQAYLKSSRIFCCFSKLDGPCECEWCGWLGLCALLALAASCACSC